MSRFPIYMDHHATTPCDPRVVERMMPFFGEVFGNPASIAHAHGRKAATALEEARAATADFLRVRPTEMFFTAGATEANNIALFGAGLDEGSHLIVSSIEHHSVLVPAAVLERRGVEVTRLETDGEGFVHPDRLEAALRPNTRLVSVMMANGDIGTIEPVEALAAICRMRGILFHTDATQAVGKVPVDLSVIPCDLLSMSAHKIYGPKGVGALFVRKGVRLTSPIVGGGQEKGMRSGTVNLPGAVGLAEALEIRRSEMSHEAERLTALRIRLWDRLTGEIPGAFVAGPRENRLAGNLSIGFEHVDSESLIMALRNFSVSAGSACSSGEREPSHVLRAIGYDDDRSRSIIRVGLGKSTSAEDCELFVSDAARSVAKLREIAVQR